MHSMVPELTSYRKKASQGHHGTIGLNHLAILPPQPQPLALPFFPPSLPPSPAAPLLPLGQRYLVDVSDQKSSNTQLCVDQTTYEQLTARAVELGEFSSKAHLLLADCDGVQQPRDVYRTEDKVYLILGKTYGDMHNFLKEKKSLTEAEAAPLFQQIVSLVAAAHDKNLALRDLKLKKFVFTNSQRTTLKLQNLEDAQFLDKDGLLSERHGCPAYVCPEMLQPGSYSGRAADLWSLGVILYTLLVGHYPFFDTNPQNLFGKIRSGYYHIPDHVSYLACTLISSLLAYEPEKRIPAKPILAHPWFSQASDEPILPHTTMFEDQTVPSHKLC